MSEELDAYRVAQEPYYRPVADEVELFEAAYSVRMPMMLKGPTGCGKTRFVEHMAWKLNKPLITVACNEDMTASDLVGRFLLDANGTRWQDGPLAVAARHGAICYLDGVGTAFVVVQVGEQVGPHRGPSAGRRFSRHRSGQFLAVHTGLGRDLETGQDVCVLGRVMGFPVSAAVFLDTGVVGFGGHALCS